MDNYESKYTTTLKREISFIDDGCYGVSLSGLFFDEAWVVSTNCSIEVNADDDEITIHTENDCVRFNLSELEKAIAFLKKCAKEELGRKK